jgi:hypothetical protein
MKIGYLMAGVAGLLTTGAVTALGAAADHPYSAIVERNPFGLKPIPQPAAAPQPDAPPPAPSRDIKLTGISTLLGPAKVILEIIDPTTKKTERPSGMLAGEQQFEVEVISIDAVQGIVKIRNRGVEATLDFVNNGIKPGASAPPPAAPVPAPVQTAFRPPPPPGSVPGLISPVSPAPASNSRAIVAGGPGGSTPGAPTVNAPNGVPADMEARIEAYRKMMQARQQNGSMPGVSGIVPPTSLTPPR